MSEIPEAIGRALNELTTKVAEVRDGVADRETVDRIANELVELQRQVQNTSGYRPGDHAPDARAIGGSFGERMEQLHTRDVGYLSGVTRVPEARISEFQARADEVLILDTLMRGRAAKNGDAYDVRQSAFYQEEFLPLARAMDTSTSGEGADWVPRNLSAELIKRVSLKLRVVALFRSFQQPTPVFDFPAMGVSRQRTGKHAEQTADTGQTKFTVLTPATRKVTLTAVKFAARVLVSKEAEEDEIIPVLPFIRDELVDFLAADQEDAVINGDTAGTHQDSDVTASDDPRKNWNGLRKLAISAAKTDGGSDALAVADLRVNRKKMGKYGIEPGSLAHLVSMASYIDLLSDASVITVDKMGPQATILAGQLAAVDGSPIIVSEYCRSNLNASGVYDGTTTTQGSAITVHTGGYIVGERRGVTTEYLRELYAESDQDAVIASTRKSFTPLYTSSTEPTVAVTYNVDQ